MPAKGVDFTASQAQKFTPNAVYLDVITGGKGEAVVTLWQRNGYPLVAEVMARAGVVWNDFAGSPVYGVRIQVGFAENIPDTAIGIRFVVYQDDLVSANPVPQGFSLVSGG
jgi:hypothetical protein